MKKACRHLSTAGLHCNSLSRGKVRNYQTFSSCSHNKHVFMIVVAGVSLSSCFRHTFFHDSQVPPVRETSKCAQSIPSAKRSNQPSVPLPCSITPKQPSMLPTHCMPEEAAALQQTCNWMQPSLSVTVAGKLITTSLFTIPCFEILQLLNSWCLQLS